MLSQTFKFKKITLAIALTLPLLNGCSGSSGASATDTSNLTTTDITVERGPVLNAVVKDKNGKMAVAQGNGVYRFTGDFEYPLETTGGVIDLNHNGLVDDGDLKTDGLKLRANEGKVLTLASTLATNTELQQKLLENIDLSADAIQTHTPSTDKAIAALSDEIYKYCIENGITDASTLTTEQWTAIELNIQNRIADYLASEKTAAELEQEMVDGLVDPLNPPPLLSREEIDAINNNEGTHSLATTLATLPVYDLTDEQKATLAFMWNEEKMAKDLYFSLNDLYPSQTLYNIATNAETEHQNSVAALLQRYNLDLEYYTDPSYSFSQAQLDSYPAGSFSNSDVQALYNALYTEGAASAQASLEVGCKVEVTDINDLNTDIEVAGDAQDIRMVFESLRKGSYSHYWGFDSALKAQGVTDGCCSLGADFCHPEYPANDMQKQGQGSAAGTGEGMKLQKGKH